MELWDVYNEDRSLRGDTMVRGDKFQKSMFHLVIHVCLFNEEGQMLIQKRQPFKDGWSGLWDITVGGSAQAGEDSRLAAEREVAEEIGYHIDLTGIRPNLTINFGDGFDDIYLLHGECDPTTLKLQESEVEQVKWATKEEIFQMIDQESFIPYYKNMIGLLFDLRNQKSGCRSHKDNSVPQPKQA